MEWREIVQIHKTIREMPEYEKLLQSLHEDAFQLNDITSKVDIEIDHGEFIISLRMGRIPVTVASFRLSENNDGRIWTIRPKVSDGFQIKIPTDSGGNITIYQLGKITKEEAKSGK